LICAPKCALSELNRKGCAYAPPRMGRRARAHKCAAASTEVAAATDNLIQWATANGMTDPAVMLNKDRTAVAARTCSPNDILVAVPEKLCVTLYDVQEHELVGALGADVDDYVGLTLWLLAERAKGASSTWQAYLASLPEKSSSPLLWDAELAESLLKGSPVLPLAKLRAAAIETEYYDIYERLAAAMAQFPEEAYSLSAFRNAFSVVLQRVVYLPSADVLALIPFVDGIQPAGSKGALLDFDTETSTVKIMSDGYYVAGDPIRIADSLGRANGELLLTCGIVNTNNMDDCLEWNVSLLQADGLYSAKNEILQAVGLSANQTFPIYTDKMPFQLLAYLRMSRITNPMELAMISFAKDQKVSDINEYETLMLMVGECRDRLANYQGVPEEDLKRLQQPALLTPEELLACKLRVGEKRILQETLSVVRRRLAPIKGFPNKKGKMVDPNADLTEIFDSLEAIPNAPKKAIGEFLSWARGEQDPDWNRKKK